jgi:hypothetical protein
MNVVSFHYSYNMTVESNFKGLAMDSSLILSGAGLILMISLARFLFLRPKKLNLPVIGGEHCENKNHRAALIEGTLKVS